MSGRHVVLTLLFVSGIVSSATATSVVDSLLAWRDAGRPDLVEARAGPAITSARTTNDSTSLLSLLLVRGATRAGSGQARQAENDLREALALARVRNDTLRQLQGIRWLSVAVGSQGRGPEAADLYRELESRALAAGDSLHLAWAWVGLGYDDYLQGHPAPAAEHYARAARALERHGENTGAMWAWNGRAMALRQAGRYDEAREAFEEVLALAGIRGDGVNAATALDNLGRLDLQLGDPGRAVRHFTRSAAIHRELQQHREGLVPCIDLARARQMQGRHARSTALLDSVLAVTRTLGLRDLEVLAANQLADVYMARERPGAAAALCRNTLAAGPMPSRLAHTETLLRLARALAGRDSTKTAVALLETIDQPGAVSLELRVASLLGSLLPELDRNEHAIAVLEPALELARTTGADVERVELLTALGRALADQGRRDAALHAYREAVDTWEEVRSRPADPAWRELRGTVAGSLFAEAAALLVDDPTRTGEAWTLVQRYRARTLQERMRGPTGNDPAPARIPDLDTFRRQVLRPGELWLEIVEGDRLAVIFSISGDSVRADLLKGRSLIQPRMRRLIEVVASPDVQGSGAARAMARSLLSEWPDGLRQRIHDAGRILWCPDGSWHQYPIALADLPGPTTRVPAATVLAQLRTTGTPGAASGQILAVSGPGAHGPSVLPGAAAELSWLRNNLAAVKTPAQATGPAAWRGAEVLHIAAHTELDARQPWNTSIRLGIEASENVRAASICDQELDARLVVLTGCTTVGSRLMGGEGLIGLSSAFLAAGAHTVLATLWPVDDAAALHFTTEFYEGLADGLTADVALVRARDRCRSDPSLAAPRHWAGFTLVGDGDVVVPVRRRRPRWPLAAASGFLATMVFVYYRRH